MGIDLRLQRDGLRFFQKADTLRQLLIHIFSDICRSLNRLQNIGELVLFLKQLFAAKQNVPVGLKGIHDLFNGLKKTQGNEYGQPQRNEHHSPKQGGHNSQKR